MSEHEELAEMEQQMEEMSVDGAVGGKEKERVRALWAEVLDKEEEAVKILFWKAERALFHGLTKPVAADTSARGKWRRWHDATFHGYVGGKYPVEAGGGEAE